MSDKTQPKTGSRGEAPGQNASAPPELPPLRTGGRAQVARHRASSEPAVAALRMEDLTLWVIQHVAKMPKAHKFTLGERWTETCLDVTSLLVDASFMRDKLPLLAQAARGLTRARVLARLHHRLRILGETQLIYFGEQSTEISKMVGGWAKALRQRREAAV